MKPINLMAALILGLSFGQGAAADIRVAGESLHVIGVAIFRSPASRHRAITDRTRTRGRVAVATRGALRVRRNLVAGSRSTLWIGERSGAGEP